MMAFLIIGLAFCWVFASAPAHANNTGNFRDEAKYHMRKSNGVPKTQFGPYFKEYKWCFNNPKPQEQLVQIKQWVKIYLN